MSRVKPAKILMLRSRPRTSERMTVSLSGGGVDEDGLFEGGKAGPRLGLFMMGRWGRCD